VPLAATTAGALVVFARAWHPRLPLTVGYDFAPPQDLGYLDVIAIGVDSARYVEANLPDAEVYGSVPESYELTRPYEGYVTSPHSVAPCSSFVPHPGKTQVLFRHPYSPGQVPCAELVLQTGSRFLRRFVSNGKWVELYVVPRAVGKPSEPP
jgi:hypothetical protein